MSNKSLHFTLFILLIIVVASSCKRRDNSSYYIYNKDTDTIKPTIQVNVPIALDDYISGEDIHIIGNVNDLENVKKAGKLKSFNYKIERLSVIDSSFMKNIYTNTPNVDGKEAYTFSDKFVAPFDTIKIFCRLTANATDYAGKLAVPTVLYFDIN
jgi:hypothetical protein